MPIPPRFLAVFAALSFVVAAAAQDWRTEKVADCGLSFDAPNRLERLPMQLGQEAVYLRARLRPKDDADYIRARYAWDCDVLEFRKTAPKEGEIEVPEGVPPEFAEQWKQLMLRFGGQQKKSFKDWLSDQPAMSRREFDLEGKAKKGRSGKLDYTHWAWREKNGYGPCGITYYEVAVYTFEDREVALMISMPLESENSPKPKGKWKTIVDRMIGSGAALAADTGGDEFDKKRDRYADNDEKKQALAAAKKNIEGLAGWDYFTQPNYIVLYSWDFEKPAARLVARKEAEYYSSRLEKMRELYLANYPLDATGTKALWPDAAAVPEAGPARTGERTEAEKAEAEAEAAHERENKDKLGKLRYSVFRLCATYEQFQKYGQSPAGVVGWFSPQSKELVVFLGGDKMMGSGATEAVTYHEGWHQYADFYFDHPLTPRRGELHRWFDEAHGDYFGSFRLNGGTWKYLGSKMRNDDVKQMVRVGDYVPFKDIVFWDRRLFYSERAPYYYAQAYSMIDYLRRGEKDKNWDPRYGKVLDTYRVVMLTTGSARKASEAAFQGFTAEDWTKLETAWKGWVNGPNWLNGR